METLNPTHSLTQSDVTSLWWGNELVGPSWHEEMVSWDVSGALAGCPSWYHQSMTSTDDSGTRSQVCWVQHINHFLTMENPRAAKNELDNKCINIFTYSFCRVSVHWRNLSALCSRWTEHTKKTVIVKKTSNLTVCKLCELEPEIILTYFIFVVSLRLCQWNYWMYTVCTLHFRIFVSPHKMCKIKGKTNTEGSTITICISKVLLDDSISVCNLSTFPQPLPS